MSASVTALIEHLKAGNDDAAQKLWEDFYPRLVVLARQKLQATSRRVADEEDVALSAFDSLCAGARQGRFPLLKDRDNLWGLLVTIIDRKAADLANYNRRQKRGGGQVRGHSAFGPGPDAGRPATFDDIAADDPTPALAAQLAEQVELLLSKLSASQDPHLRAIAIWKLEGYDNTEIAQKLGCSVPTVERRLRLIRTILSHA